MGKRNGFFILILILTIAAFFRFFDLKEIPLGLYPDEAMNGNNALEALKTMDFKIFYPENNGREGLFINLQALSLWLLGNEPWALRVVSAIFGILTVLGVYLLSHELFSNTSPQIQNSKLKTQNDNSKFKIFNFSLLTFHLARGEVIALLSSFFLATSFWHINFSRIGFRAIAVPFFATLGMYFLLKGFRQKKTPLLVWAGIVTGLGFYTYIGFRFMPLALIVPLAGYLRQWYKRKKANADSAYSHEYARRPHDVHAGKASCAPRAIMLFIFIAFLTVLPLGWYFLNNPSDFVGRSAQVSIFSAESPTKEFLKSTGITLQMLFWQGDCNWRHNFACRPELHPLVALFLLLGIATLFRRFQKASTEEKINYAAIFMWLGAMALPAALTREGLPHALRSIGMIPPVMILAGYGAWITLEKILEWIERQKTKVPERSAQLGRIRYETIILFLAILITIPWVTYRDYFVRWAYNPETYFAFSTDLLNLGNFLAHLPRDTNKYVVANLPGVDVRGIPMPAQTVMFVTDTFGEEKQNKKKIFYISPADAAQKIYVTAGEKTVIAFLNGSDKPLINMLKKNLPGYAIKAPGDFVIMQNY